MMLNKQIIYVTWLNIHEKLKNMLNYLFCHSTGNICGFTDSSIIK